MNAARLHQFNEPLRLDQIADPAITHPTDVIVKIGGAGVCHTDLHLMEGVWHETLRTPLPYTIGHENAGWVHEVGSAVVAFKPGDAVIAHPIMSCGRCLPCRIGEDMHCENSKFPGLTIDGGYAQFLKTSERALVHLAPNVTPMEVAPLADAGITAYRAVKRAVPLSSPGTRAVIIGLGGLGHIAIQLMRELGNSDIIAVDRNRQRLDMAVDYGAWRAVVADHNAVSAVRQLTNDRGADIILDFVGTDETHSQSLAMMRKGGSCFVIGYGGTIRIPSLDLINRELSILGSLVGNYAELYELMQLYFRGKVKLHSKEYSLNDANQVLNMLHNGEINGRAVLVP